MKHNIEVLGETAISHAAVLGINGKRIEWLLKFNVLEGGIVSTCNAGGEDENCYTMYDPDGGPVLEVGDCFAEVTGPDGITSYAFITSMRRDLALAGLVVCTDSRRIMPKITLEIDR